MNLCSMLLQFFLFLFPLPDMLLTSSSSELPSHLLSGCFQAAQGDGDAPSGCSYVRSALSSMGSPSVRTLGSSLTLYVVSVAPTNVNTLDHSCLCLLCLMMPP